MRRLVIVPVFSLLASCAEKPPVSTSAASSKAAPAPKLIETPGAKLGTAPSGFGLDVGTQAPDVSLPDISGRTQHLGELYAQGRTLQLHDFSVAKPQFDARGVAIVAISVDKPSEQARTQAKQGVPFPMLSDPKLVAHQAYRVVHVPGDEERRALDEYHLDLAAYSGESHGNFAVPAIFLVDRGGTIRFVHIDEDYTTRPSARQMLEVVDRIPTAK